ncbi:KH domain-containing protein [Candidatus Saccharibacteria bacterium]|nr:KH domain-containing protein [Candidatus Saccharibacteria bacterium]
MANSIDQQFIEYIVKSVVGNPDAVSIKRTIDEKGVLLELTVDPEDLGRVIGKRGATAQSLRTLLRALGTKNDARYNLKIIDVGGPRPPRQDSTDDRQPADQPDEVPVEEPTEQPETPSNEEVVEEERTEEIIEEKPSDVVSRTRAELADLDDLDV